MALRVLAILLLLLCLPPLTAAAQDCDSAGAPVEFAATAGPGGAAIGAGLVWTLTGADGGTLPLDGARPQRRLPPGGWRVRVERPADGATAEAEFTTRDAPLTVTLVLPPLLPRAVLSAPSEAPVGATVPVDWSFPAADEGPADYIAAARPGTPDAASATHAYLKTAPARLRLPLEPGDWELRYVASLTGAPPRVLARIPIRLADVPVSLDAPATVLAGSSFRVGHDGPDYAADYLTIARPGAPDADYATYAYVGRARSATIVAPPDPGPWEIRYVASGDVERVLGRRPLTVAPVEPVLRAPAAAPAGSLLEIGWIGPVNDYDYISVARPDDPADVDAGYAYTRSGNPARIPLPLDPGGWELRYVANGGEEEEILGRRPLEITPVAAELRAPGAAVQGSVIEVGWSGPANRNDFIAIAAPGQRADQSVAHAYAAGGTPLRLAVPVTPGDYELRYVANGTPPRVLARQPLRVAAARTSLAAPDSAAAGGLLPVGWTGPGNGSDVIALARPGSPPEESLAQARAAEGSPALLTLPPQPGAYELRYVARGETALVLAARPLVLTPEAATLAAPSEAPQGAGVEVRWTGPANPRDLIAVARPGDGPGDYIASRSVRDGSPVVLALPTGAGAYEIRYVAHGRPGAVLARQPVAVTSAFAALDAPPEAVQGAMLEIGWTGPGNAADRIALARPQAAPGEALDYALVRNGSPAALRAPLAPGDYELRYVVPGAPQDVVLARRPLRITAAEVALDAPAEGAAGATVAVGWTGPDNPGDRIAVAPAGSGDDALATRSFTRDGRPAALTLPIRPGDYEIRYLARGTPDAVLARAPIRVTPVTAGLAVPAAAPAGTRLEAGWSGPGYRGDYIALARPGAAKALAWAYTATGNPVRLALPETPGSYELRYVAGQGDTVLARQLLRLD